MNDAEQSSFRSDLQRYEQLLSSAIAEPFQFSPTRESADALQIERGAILTSALLNRATPDLSPAVRLMELPGRANLRNLAVVDAAGHARPVYRPLLIYACLQTFRICYESIPQTDFGRWDESMRAWSDLLEAELPTIDKNPAAAAWTALAIFVAGKIFVRDAWTDLAADTFGRITRAQRDNGPFLELDQAANPESRWYEELCILHAAASYAVQSEDRPLAAAVARATGFHLNETQPDHASAQPWGLFAFIWNASTRPLADQLLHSMQIAHPQDRDGISLMLCADSLYCLRLFL